MTAPRTGVYICHCGTNIAAMVDVEEVRDWAARGARRQGRGRLARLPLHVLEPGPGAHRERHQGIRPRARGGGRLLAAHAREDLPRGQLQRRPEPVPDRAGVDPRAGLVGPHRQGQGHREGQGHHRRRRLSRSRAGAAGTAHRPGQQRHPHRRRRHRRHHRGAGDRRCRLPGPHRGARAVHRRPHGPVRQDLPDARLRGLHPDPQDGRRGRPPQHHAPHLERGGRRLRLGRRLQDQGQAQATHGGRGRLHRLRHLLGEVPGPGHRHRLRVGHRLPQGHLHAVPAGGAQVSGADAGGLHLLPEGHLQGLREVLSGRLHRLHPDRRVRRAQRGQHPAGHRLRSHSTLAASRPSATADCPTSSPRWSSSA